MITPAPELHPFDPANASEHCECLAGSEPAGGALRFVLELVRQNDRAFLIRKIEPGAAELWLPRSQVVQEPGTVQRRVFSRTIEVIRLEVPRWLAEQKGLVAAKSDDRQGSLL